MKSIRSKWFFPLAALEGAFTLAWTFATPSGAARAYLFGLSKARLALSGLAGLAFLLCLWAAWQSLRSPAWWARVGGVADRRLVCAGLLVPALISLAVLCLGGLGLAAWTASLPLAQVPLYTERLGTHFSVLYGLLSRGLPFLVWGAVLAGQALVGLALAYRAALRERQPGRWQTAASTLLFWLIALLTLAHWTILALRLNVLTRIPGWAWGFKYKPFTPRDALFLGLLALLIAAAAWISRRPRAVWRNLLMLALLAYAVQFSIGVLDGKGIESLRERFYNSPHKTYTNKAAQSSAGVLETIRTYEAVYSYMLFPSTKPPGVMTIYIALERSINAFTHLTSSAARYQQLSTFIAWTFPVLSLGALFFIYFYQRRVLSPGAEPARALPGEAARALPGEAARALPGEAAGTLPGGAAGALAGQAAAYLSPMLYAITPNIVLLSLFLDQAFYPSLFLAGTLLSWLAYRRQSLALAFLAGVGLYVAIFFTFAMFPLFAFAGLYWAADFWLHRDQRRWLPELGLLLATGLGVAAAFGLFRLTLNYDFFARYQNATSVVYNYDYYLRVDLTPGQPVTPVQRVHQILIAAHLNNIDFATAVGIPVFILFALRGVKASLAVIRRRALAGEAAQAALFLSYVALNAYGQIRGEAARLWMYWVPVAVLLAGAEIAPLVKRRPALGYLLLAAQFVTLALTYQFQDLHM